MDTLQLIMLFTALLVAGVVISWLDHKNGWQFATWFNGEVANPFGNSNKPAQETDKDQIIAQLTERIQVLEKIVTEPAYELNKKLNRL